MASSSAMAVIRVLPSRWAFRSWRQLALGGTQAKKVAMKRPDQSAASLRFADRQTRPALTHFVRVVHRAGFEPTLTAWKAEVIPLDQRCVILARNDCQISPSITTKGSRGPEVPWRGERGGGQSPPPCGRRPHLVSKGEAFDANRVPKRD